MIRLLRKLLFFLYDVKRIVYYGIFFLSGFALGRVLDVDIGLLGVLKEFVWLIL